MDEEVLLGKSLGRPSNLPVVSLGLPNKFFLLAEIRLLRRREARRLPLFSVVTLGESVGLVLSEAFRPIEEIVRELHARRDSAVGLVNMLVFYGGLFYPRIAKDSAGR